MVREPDVRGPHTLWAWVKSATPYILAVGLFGAGIWALNHLLHEVSLREISQQVRHTPTGTLFLAMLTTLGAYLALVGYDWSALRYIGKPLPLPITVTGGLMAYAFGNTIGLSAVSGGAVRYRVYSGLGLDGYDVAAVSSFAAMSFGTAATVVGLGALAAQPDALGRANPLPLHMTQIAAIIGICVIIVPLVWAALRKGTLRIGRFTLRAPSLSVLCGQILFSAIDIGCAAMTLFLLMPTGDLGFFSFLGIFAAASMAGILSHVPGGVGVFETVVIAALPPGVPISQAAAGLLMFRAIYYFLPFLIALLVLAFYEISLLLRGGRDRMPATRMGRAMGTTRPALRAVTALAPQVLAALTFAAGMWMSFAALIPPRSNTAEAMELFFPQAFVEGGALVSSAVGAGLIVLSLGMARRSLGAFWLTIVALAIGAGAALVQGLDARHAALFVGIALLILPFRREFHRRTSLVHGAFSPLWFLLVTGLLISVGLLLFFAEKGQPYAHELWWQFAANDSAPRALRTGVVASLLIALAALVMLLRVPHLHPMPPTPDEIATAARIVAMQDSATAAIALTGDKSLLFSDDRRGFIAFAVQGRTWLAMGGPIGHPDCREELVWAFVDAARRSGARPAFYEVTPDDAGLMIDLGMSLHKLGDQAVIPLTALPPLHLPQGALLAVSTPPHTAARLAPLAHLQDMRPGRRFAEGSFVPHWINRWRLATLTINDHTIAAAALLECGDRTQISYDALRIDPQADPAHLAAFLPMLAHQMATEGRHALILGIVASDDSDPRLTAPLWLRIAAALRSHAAQFYASADSRAAYARLTPQWQPRYLAAPSASPPFQVLADAALILGGTDRAIHRP